MGRTPVVAATDVSWLCGSRCGHLPVGIVRWPDPEERTTVVVKATYAFEPRASEQVVKLATEQVPFAVDTPCPRRGAGAHELDTPADLIACKRFADVMLKGHAHASSAVDRIEARIVVADVDRAFITTGPSATERMPLTQGFIRDADGNPAAPVGPAGPWTVRAPEPEPLTYEAVEELRAALAADREAAFARYADLAEDEDDELEETFVDWDDLPDAGEAFFDHGVQYAADAQRAQFLDADATFTLENLVAGGGRRTLRLAGHRPLVVYETMDAAYAVYLDCDTVLIDTDENRMEVTWRGQVARGAETYDMRRIIVSLENERRPRSLQRVMRALPRGHHFAAIDAEALRNGSPPGDDPDVALVRSISMMVIPEPELTLEELAAVSASLHLDRPRAAVLADHALSEELWHLERRAWREIVNDAVRSGDLDQARKIRRALRAGKGASS